ncbi:MAG: EAL domain-containing protein [Gammaproteobacteria bacterium]|nr:EAL domain-containing protein [Gammaproteobacteria bacterium]
MSVDNIIKVLLVEDNEGDIRLIKEMLSHDCPGEFMIETVNRLQEAIEIIKQEKFDVVLTDLSLPDSDGMETISRIQESNSNLPIIVLSGQESESLAMKIVQSGAQDYLVKGQGDGHLISKTLRYAIERKHIQEGLSYLAQYDSLTGLANRNLFRERLGRALIRVDRSKSLVALMFIDLDRFKNINDTLGHDAGDKLLIEVSRRLEKCTRDGDTVARLGGDEFTVILEDIKHVDDAAIIARKILVAMEPAIKLSGYEVFVTPSIGITIYPLDDTSVNNLLKNADTAMYRAKERGRNGFQFYTAGMNTRTIERLELEAGLRRALKNNEFVLYYQPKIAIDNRQIIGAEALIRWQYKKLGLIPPLKFIPIAEETGLIVPIGEWVIRTACKQVASWQEAGFRDLRMAVNISARQFTDSDIVKVVLDAVIQTNIEPQHLEVEITESMLMEDTSINISSLKELKEHGVHISIDDFGTGYSSLSYLKRFHIDALKIDQSFVRDITTDSDDAAIASAVIALGQSLHLTVVAEGVETEEQLSFLKKQGCHEAQGYLFSKPVPAEDFAQLLQEEKASQSHKLVTQMA